MNVETKWYYADGENVVGPFDHAALAGMIRAGLVQGETQIAEQGEQTWCRIDETPFREHLATNAAPPAAPVLQQPSGGELPLRFKHILGVLLHASATLLKLGWEKVKRLGLLFWKFRSQVSTPWRYAIDGSIAILVIGSGFAVSSLNNPEADKADGWYGYGYNIGDYCAGKVNAGELARTDATSGRELWSLVNVIDSEKVGHLSAVDRSACEEGYFAGLYGHRAKHPARVVEQHPSGLVITSASKLRTGTIMRVSYAGTISETVVFEKNPVRVKANFDAVETFISRLPKLTGEDFRWERNIDAREVLTFLNGFSTHRDAPKVDSRLLASYIRKKISEGELTRWSVALISTKEGKKYDVAGYVGGVVTRAPHPPLGEQRSDKITIRRLVNPTDEEIGLSKEDRDAALAWTREKWAKDGEDQRGGEPSRLSGTAIRHVRPKEEGLLLIYPLSPEEYKTDPEVPVMGIALSFPGTDNPDGVEYRVNNTYWEQEFELV